MVSAVPVPVANIAYATAELAAGIEGSQATASAGATALWDLDFSQADLTAGLGPLISDIVLLYGVGVVALSSAPTLALSAVTYGAPGASAAAPTVAAAGGTITTIPGTLPTATSGAGNLYTVQFGLAAPVRMNTDLQKIVARLSVPMANTGTFLLVGAFVHHASRIAQ